MHDDGFQSVMRLDDAHKRLQEVCEPHGRSERVAIEHAVGRILAEPVSADRAVPHYDRAAMDGYAVRAQDTFDAGEQSPARFELADDAVGDRRAVQVHTGSAIPEGGDAVVMVERTEERSDDLLIYDALARGENVAPAGEDVTEGQHLLDAGRRLRPSDAALLRATGRDEVPVFDRPRVSVIPTGEELVDPGEEPGPGEVVETNGLVVSSLVEKWDGAATYRDVVTDDADALGEAIDQDTDHDIVVTTGGSSVGERDLLPDVVSDLGEVLVHGVALKPGHPVGFGVVDETPVVFLPGYPVSCLVTAMQLLRPAIAWLSDTAPRSSPTMDAELAEKLRSEPGERTFARVRLLNEEGEADDEGTNELPRVEPVRVSGAGVMSSVTEADGWVTVPESLEGIPAGNTVTVEQWEDI